jgi:uncharacterized protein (TIGR03067 family)
MRRFFVLLAGLCSLAFAPSPPDPGKVDLRRLQGTWTRTACATRPVGDPVTTSTEDGQFEMVISGDLVTMTYGGEHRGSYRITLDARKKPKAIDFRTEERIDRGIYNLDGNTLTICTQMVPRGPRPTQINAVRDGERREVFKRKEP